MYLGNNVRSRMSQQWNLIGNSRTETPDQGFDRSNEKGQLMHHPEEEMTACLSRVYLTFLK